RIVVRLRVRVGVGHDARQPDDLLLIAGVVDHHGVALPHRSAVLRRDAVLHAIPHRAPTPLAPAEAVRRRLRLHDPVARHPHLACGLSTRRRGNTYGPSDPEAIPTGPDSNPWRPSPLTRAAYRGHPTGRDPPPRASGWAVRPRASVMPGSTDRSAIRTPALSRTAKWTAGLPSPLSLSHAASPPTTTRADDTDDSEGTPRGGMEDQASINGPDRRSPARAHDTAVAGRGDATPGGRWASTSCAMCAPMLSEAVAAGEGAFRTWTDRSPCTMTKSSTSLPCASTACARTPDLPGTRSAACTRGTSRWSSRTSRSLLSERANSATPDRQYFRARRQKPP